METELVLHRKSLQNTKTPYKYNFTSIYLYDIYIHIETLSIHSTTVKFIVSMITNITTFIMQYPNMCNKCITYDR